MKYDKVYFSLLFASIAIFAVFSYLTYLAYIITVGTQFMVYAYIIVVPVLVSLILFALLIHLGRRGFTRELVRERRYL